MTKAIRCQFEAYSEVIRGKLRGTQIAIRGHPTCLGARREALRRLFPQRPSLVLLSKVVLPVLDFLDAEPDAPLDRAYKGATRSVGGRDGGVACLEEAQESALHLMREAISGNQCNQGVACLEEAQESALHLAVAAFEHSNPEAHAREGELIDLMREAISGDQCDQEAIPRRIPRRAHRPRKTRT